MYIKNKLLKGVIRMKCVDCGKELTNEDRVNYDYEYDEDEKVWCMACYERESDGGNIY